MSTIKEAKKQAIRLTSRLSELGVSINRAQALECIAAINNHSDWNHYSASLNTKDLASAATPALCPAAVYHNDLALTVLAMRTGAGKSVILYHCIAEALSQADATSILIRYGVKEIPATILSQCTIINATVNHKEEVDLPELNGALNRVIICSLHSDFLFQEREKLLGAVFTKLISSLPDAFLNKLRYFLMDDCHGIGWNTLSAAIENTHRHLKKRGGSKIVVSCQELPSVDVLPSIPTSVITDSGTIGYIFFERILADYTAITPLQFYLADDFGHAVDFSDQHIMIKNIATFALWNIHKYRSPDSIGISLPLIGGNQLTHLKSTSDELFGFAKNSS